MISLSRDSANIMREEFEAAHSYLIQVDPYRRSNYSAGHNDDVSSIEFKANWGYSLVDLRWCPREDVLKLSKDQRDELTN